MELQEMVAFLKPIINSINYIDPKLVENDKLDHQDLIQIYHCNKAKSELNQYGSVPQFISNLKYDEHLKFATYCISVIKCLDYNFKIDVRDLVYNKVRDFLSQNFFNAPPDIQKMLLERSMELSLAVYKMGFDGLVKNHMTEILCKLHSKQFYREFAKQFINFSIRYNEESFEEKLNGNLMYTQFIRALPKLDSKINSCRYFLKFLMIAYLAEKIKIFKDLVNNQTDYFNFESQINPNYKLFYDVLITLHNSDRSIDLSIQLSTISLIERILSDKYIDLEIILVATYLQIKLLSIEHENDPSEIRLEKIQINLTRINKIREGPLIGIFPIINPKINQIRSELFG